MRIHIFRKWMWGYRVFGGTKAFDIGPITIYW